MTAAPSPPPADLPPEVYRALLANLDGAGMGVGLFDAEDRLRYANAFFLDAFATTLDPAPTWEQMMRRCQRDRVGLLIDTPDMDAWVARVRQHYRQVAVRSFESDFVDGRWMRVRETVDEAGWVFATMADITSLKTSEAALQQARDKAVLAARQDIEQALARQRELVALKTNFVAMSSHEFRTPLATILSSTELLRDYGERLPAPEKEELTRSIEAGVRRMAQMLDRVLRIGQLDAGLLEFSPQPLQLRALCGSLLAGVRTQHPDSPCTLVADFAMAPEQTALVDEKLLRHIFENLLSNAIKYSPQGGEVRFKVYREAGDDSAHWVFQVMDQGIGIPADALKDLFEPFRRAGNVGQISGTGLGLAIVKSSVELHQGSIAVDSVLGQGSCFTVRIGPHATSI